MAKLEQHLENFAGKLGTVWVPPISLKELIEKDRIRIAGTDNAICIEIDGAVWTPPDAFRLEFFP